MKPTPKERLPDSFKKKVKDCDEVKADIEKHYKKVETDNATQSTKARVAKLNVLDAMKKHISEEYTLADLQMVVDANPQYHASSFFYKSKTKALLHEVINLKDGEEVEKAFNYRK